MVGDMVWDMIEDVLVNVTDEDVMAWSVNGEHNDETILYNA